MMQVSAVNPVAALLFDPTNDGDDPIISSFGVSSPQFREEPGLMLDATFWRAFPKIESLRLNPNLF
jgi:hypothetical protein